MKKSKSTFPDFKTDVLLTFSDVIPKDFLIERLKNDIEGNDLSVAIELQTKMNDLLGGEWISYDSFIELYISDNFVLNHFIKSTNTLKVFIKNLEIVLQPLVEATSEISSRDETKHSSHYEIFSVFFKTPDNYVFRFLFELFENGSKFLQTFNLLLETLVVYSEKGANDLNKAVKQSYSLHNKIKYFLFRDNKWIVVNPILEVGKEINESYIEKKDFRIKKPIIMMHKNSFRKYLIYDNNWSLNFDGLKTLMIRPNDVSIYSNISDHHLNKAQTFYSEIIIPRHKYYHGNFPGIEQQKEYFSYFETIITSLIFAYTALEAFANICIPDSFEYLIEKDGIKTIYSKHAIEQKFSLREKLKVIIKSILNTSDPSIEKWWNTFILLEDLRNEIIHTKQSKSEKRYSKLLTKRIFKIIAIHKEIIKFYGHYIFKNKKPLLGEFPYNFGYDGSIPRLVSNKYYEEMFLKLYNPQPIAKRKKI
jgi:hypothetical protein